MDMDTPPAKLNDNRRETRAKMAEEATIVGDSGVMGSELKTSGTENPDTTLEIVQEKFRVGEKVIAVFESYQIVGNETPNRLLALVSSTGTNAIFSFAVSRLPPETFSDLSIDNIFPINDDFYIQADDVNGIGKLQFVIYYSGGQATFYYYPYSSISLTDFNEFYLIIEASSKKYKAYVKSLLDAKGVQIESTQHSFNWINSYKRQGDYAGAIDRLIADGSKPLKKGESKFQDELKKHEHEYIVYKKFRIYCATWNVNGQPCNDVSLKGWLSATEEAPDIYAVGFQELDLSPKAITFNETRPDPVWIRKLWDNLHSGAVYEELKSVRLVGMMLTIFVRKEIRPYVTRCWIQTVGTGALNFMGNKGGVGVSLTLNEADICFINSHLAAHVSEVERRNDDFAEIVRRLQFGDNLPRQTIDRHNHIFWIGDLNYRMNEIPGMPMDFNNIKGQLRFDQLRREMKERRVFDGYTEGEINFRPTYKYDPGTDNWDSSEKNRAPAWCDRILWKGERIDQLCYDSVMEVRLSDHKPVYAVFNTGIKTKDEQKYKRVHEEVLKRVDKYENDNQPQITVEKTDIDFDVIQFNELSIRDFTVANNCHLPVKFSFKVKNDYDKRICEDWLDVEPQCGELITGTSLSIRIKILIDSHSVWRLHNKQKDHSGETIPLDILVLDVEDGRDIFITIMGQYKPSCFGFTTEVLCRLERPISEMDFNEITAIENSINTTTCQVTMPREIFLLIDYLYKNGLQTNGLFTMDRRYARNPNINEIRDWLDSWSSNEFPGIPHTAAESLLMLLESTPEPLIHPFENQILKVETFEQSLAIIQDLSPPRKSLFLYLCMFLREGIHNKTFSTSECSQIFGNILLKERNTQNKSFNSYNNRSTQMPSATLSYSGSTSSTSLSSIATSSGKVNLPSRSDDQRRMFLHRFLTNDISKFARLQFGYVN